MPKVSETIQSVATRTHSSCHPTSFHSTRQSINHTVRLHHNRCSASNHNTRNTQTTCINIKFQSTRLRLSTQLQLLLLTRLHPNKSTQLIITIYTIRRHPTRWLARLRRITRLVLRKNARFRPKTTRQTPRLSLLINVSIATMKNHYLINSNISIDKIFKSCF